MDKNEWLQRLDALVQSKWGFSFHDMPDVFFWIDLYEDEISPEDALEACEEQWASADPHFADLYYAYKTTVHRYGKEKQA